MAIRLTMSRTSKTAARRLELLRGRASAARARRFARIGLSRWSNASSVIDTDCDADRARRAAAPTRAAPSGRAPAPRTPIRSPPASCRAITWVDPGYSSSSSAASVGCRPVAAATSSPPARAGRRRRARPSSGSVSVGASAFWVSPAIAARVAAVVSPGWGSNVRLTESGLYWKAIRFVGSGAAVSKIDQRALEQPRAAGKAGHRSPPRGERVA